MFNKHAYQYNKLLEGNLGVLENFNWYRIEKKSMGRSTKKMFLLKSELIILDLVFRQIATFVELYLCGLYKRAPGPFNSFDENRSLY